MAFEIADPWRRAANRTQPITIHPEICRRAFNHTGSCIESPLIKFYITPPSTLLLFAAFSNLRSPDILGPISKKTIPIRPSVSKRQSHLASRNLAPTPSPTKSKHENKYICPSLYPRGPRFHVDLLWLHSIPRRSNSGSHSRLKPIPSSRCVSPHYHSRPFANSSHVHSQAMSCGITLIVLGGLVTQTQYVGYLTPGEVWTIWITHVPIWPMWIAQNLQSVWGTNKMNNLVTNGPAGEGLTLRLREGQGHLARRVGRRILWRWLMSRPRQ